MTEFVVTYGSTTKHRLTVARDGQVRIKIAKDTLIPEAEHINKSLTKVAQQALELGAGTLRGAVKRGTKYNDIVLYTDSKKEHYKFHW